MNRNGIQQHKAFTWLILLLAVIVQSLLLYAIPRSNFYLTYGSFLLLFAIYYYIVQAKDQFSFALCISLAVLLRLIAVFSLPELSDDYFRFAWDGKMIASHINPFQYTPQEYIQVHQGDGYLGYLYSNMNSAEYHSVYPPVMQAIFSIAVFLFPKNIYASVVVMKLYILAAECVTMRILVIYAAKKKIPGRSTLWYILNPMIIVELTGNVHFEAVMLCFLLAGFYLLEEKKILLAAVCWAVAIATKMLPLMLAPLLLRYLGVRNFIRFGTLSMLILLVSFLPFYNVHLFTDIDASLKLFYNLFEFNGSIFYLVRWIGYRMVGYDVIEEAAPILGIISFVIILFISFRPRGRYTLPGKSLWIFFVYFLFATMVHPWYISGLVLLSVFSKTKFPLIFSLLILLSYYPYSLTIYNESNWIILIEYGLLFTFIGYEYLEKRKNLNPAL